MERYFIYFIKIENHLKIGMSVATSKHFNARYKEAQRWYPNAIVEGIAVTPSKIEEKYIHSYLESEKIQNEVFNCSKKTIELLTKRCDWIQKESRLSIDEWLRHYFYYVDLNKYIKKELDKNQPVGIDEISIDDEYVLTGWEYYGYYQIDYLTDKFNQLNQCKYSNIIISENECFDLSRQLNKPKMNRLNGFTEDGFYYENGELCISDPLGIDHRDY